MATHFVKQFDQNASKWYLQKRREWTSGWQNNWIVLKAKDGDFFVTDWLRNRNTMEFLGVWERIYNPNFNYGEFATDKFLCTVEYDYPKFHLTMHCYLCSLVGALINHIKPFL